MIGLNLQKYNKNNPTNSFIKSSGELDSVMSFTRNTIGTVYDSSGDLEVITANNPRFGKELPTTQLSGLLIENSSTNLNTDSEGTSYNSNRAFDGLSYDSEIIVNGHKLWRYYELAPSSFHRLIYPVTLSASTQYTVSFVCKLESTPLRYIGYRVDFGSGYRQVLFDRTDGSVEYQHPDFDDAGSKSLGNDYYRFYIQFTVAVGGMGNNLTYITHQNLSNSNTINSFAGDTNTYIDFGAFMVEEGSLSSYIPTEGGTVTRNADQLTTSDVSWFDAIEGRTFVIDLEVTPEDLSGGSRTVFSIDDGAESERYHLQFDSGGIRWYKRSGATGADSLYTGAYSGRIKIACSIENNTLQLAVNGNYVTSTIVTGQPVGLSRFRIGEFAGRYWNEKIYRFNVYDKAFTQQQLIDRTT